MGDSPVGVVVVDDHPGFRLVAAEVVAAMDGFEVTDEADSAERALELLAHRHEPTLVVMDVNMPGMDGVAATRALHGTNPDAFVLLVSSYAPTDLPADLASCGAIGFVSKELLSPRVLAEAWLHRRD
jgi:DNA-binding NarL/FixJ family response regulator